MQYEQSNQSNSEVELLILEEMSKQLFEKILENDTNEYLENNLTSIDFNCNISIDMMDDDPKKISETISYHLLSNSNRYYYIYKRFLYFNISTFRYKCSKCKFILTSIEDKLQIHILGKITINIQCF